MTISLVKSVADFRKIVKQYFLTTWFHSEKSQISLRYVERAGYKGIMV